MSFGPTPNSRGAGNSGEQLVQFRLSDAQRISNAVTWVESHRRDRKPSWLPRAAGSSVAATDNGIYLGTFTGPWAKGGTKNVYVGTASYSVVNHFATVDLSGKCAFARIVNGGSYILIAAECQ